MKLFGGPELKWRGLSGNLKIDESSLMPRRESVTRHSLAEGEVSTIIFSSAEVGKEWETVCHSHFAFLNCCYTVYF